MQELKNKIQNLLNEKFSEGITKLIHEEVQIIQLDKDLSKDDALKSAQPKMKGDHRGFTYNPDTGVAKYI